MRRIESVNDFVIKFANVNGTGSASANNLFAKALFRMGIPVSPKNIFPSNIQGLPTWYEVRVNDKGYLGRRGGIDIALSVNPQSMAQDIHEVLPGGYFIYDDTKPLDLRLWRDDITIVGLPLSRLCNENYEDPRQRQLFKNVIYVGALAALLDIDFKVLTGLLEDQFKGKKNLVLPILMRWSWGTTMRRPMWRARLVYAWKRAIKSETRSSLMVIQHWDLVHCMVAPPWRPGTQ